MAALVFFLTWIAIALAVFFVAMSGGPRGARQTLHSHSPSGRRVFNVVTAALAVICVGVSAAVLLINRDEAVAGEARIELTEAQKHGQELFTEYCQQCHTLAAADAVGKVGPNLDQLKPGEEQTLAAIENGYVRGAGTMPAALVLGEDAEDVASYIAAVAGK